MLGPFLPSHVEENALGTILMSCIFSFAAGIDDIQEEEETHYVDRLREYCLYADSIRYFCLHLAVIKNI